MLAPWLLIALSAAATESSAPSSSSGPSSANAVNINADLFFPLNEGYGPSKDLGYGATVSYWREWRIAVFQPQLAFHIGPGEGDARWWDLSTNLGLFIAPLDGFITPIVGGGIGVRYVSVRGISDVRKVGTVLSATFAETPASSSFGVMAHGVAGLMLFRDSPVRMIVAADYSATFIEGTPMALMLSVGIGI